MRTVKQINNLKIKLSDEDNLYRVFSPAGKVLFTSNNFSDVLKRCKLCTDYLNAKGNKSVPPVANKLTKVQIGDEAWAVVSKMPLILTRAMEDDLDFECWKLIESYAHALGIKLVDEDGETAEISFDLAKEVGELVLNQFRRAGIKII